MTARDRQQAVTRVAINGFGRMGRLALRAGWRRRDVAFVHLNELTADARTAAHVELAAAVGAALPARAGT